MMSRRLGHVQRALTLQSYGPARRLTLRFGMGCRGLAFRTPRELVAWLDKHGVNTQAYGKGVSKSISELFYEHARKESVLELQDSKPLRVVRVLSLHILNTHGQVLYEAEQVLPDGRSRRRCVSASQLGPSPAAAVAATPAMTPFVKSSIAADADATDADATHSGLHSRVPLSEKLIGDESWQEAVPRAVQEELGSALPEGYQVSLVEGSYRELQEVSSSMSYPGLPTKYTFHRVDASVTGLPAGPFETFEIRPVGRLITRWEWRVPGPDCVKRDPCEAEQKCAATGDERSSNQLKKFSTQALGWETSH
ncbi:hypothetical protein QJQ45_023741 [Haematococcus lacustris]|nr:hypothetical protein QJQ45_023741 [Haematococcus lacustris]